MCVPVCVCVCVYVLLLLIHIRLELVVCSLADGPQYALIVIACCVVF